MLESAAALVQEHADLEKRLADPEVFGDQSLVRKLNKRYAALAPTVAAYHAWHAAADDLAAAREKPPRRTRASPPRCPASRHASPRPRRRFDACSFPAIRTTLAM